MHIDYFQNLLNTLFENKILSANIDEIIITDDIVGEIERYSLNRFKLPNLTISREYRAIAKTVDFDGKKKIFFDAIYVNGYNSYTPQIFFEQFISVFSQDLVSLKYNVSNTYNHNTSLTEINKILFNQWATKVVANEVEKMFTFKKEKIHNDAKIYVDTFKRNIRKKHYKYQEDSNLEIFWIDAVAELDHFILRCLDVKFDNGSFEILQEFAGIIPSLLIEIEYQAYNLIKNEEIIFSKIKKYVLDILNICFIDIPSEDPMNVQITKSPKNLFKGNIVDTEPRIVAFMDILGFSSIIKEYDSDKTSNLLNELHDALNTAIVHAIENTKDLNAQSDLKDFLEYRMFSDCICISLPYIEFENDFHIQFNSLSTVVKSYQLIMMQKGFFIRGGISIGSYFSDKNMIFSGGLVSAHHLDKGTPVIAIHKTVIEKLNKKCDEEFKSLFIDGNLIFSTQEPEKIFLNPFDLFDNSIKYLDYFQNIMDEQIKENENDTSGILSTSLSSLLKITNLFTKPIFDSAKSQMKKENVDIEKEEILKGINDQIIKHADLLKNPKLKPDEIIEIEKILSKYDFLQKFCLWSLKKGYDNEFVIYKFPKII